MQARCCPPAAEEQARRTDRQLDRQAAIDENQVPEALSEALKLRARTWLDYLSGASSAEYVLSTETCCLFEEKTQKGTGLLATCLNDWLLQQLTEREIKWPRRHQYVI